MRFYIGIVFLSLLSPTTTTIMMMMMMIITTTIVIVIITTLAPTTTACSPLAHSANQLLCHAALGQLKAPAKHSGPLSGRGVLITIRVFRKSARIPEVRL